MHFWENKPVCLKIAKAWNLKSQTTLHSTAYVRFITDVEHFPSSLAELCIQYQRTFFSHLILITSQNRQKEELYNILASKFILPQSLLMHTKLLEVEVNEAQVARVNFSVKFVNVYCHWNYYLNIWIILFRKDRQTLSVVLLSHSNSVDVYYLNL